MLAVALLLVAAEPEAPRTVNGQILGTAEEYTTQGPARVCMNDLMVTTRPGESVSLSYSGIHNGVLRLNRAQSWVDVSMSEIFLTPRQRGELIVRHRNDFVADVSDDATLRYGLFAKDDSGERFRLLARIEGPSFAGDKPDEGVLRRIELQGNSRDCDVTYNFGWDVLLGDKPFSVRRKRTLR